MLFQPSFACSKRNMANISDMAIDSDGSDDFEDDDDVSIASLDPMEVLANIRHVPTASASRRSPISLKSLCVSKLLAIKLVGDLREQDLYDENGNKKVFTQDEINGALNTFANPSFQNDVNDLKKCCDFTSPYGDASWFPWCYKDFVALQRYGEVLAIASVANPTAQLLARNRINSLLKERSPWCISDPLTVDNPSGVTIKVGKSVLKHEMELASFLNGAISSMEDEDYVLHEHGRAFMKKWLSPYFVDCTHESGDVLMKPI
jgi:hypothetical protein